MTSCEFHPIQIVERLDAHALRSGCIPATPHLIVGRLSSTLPGIDDGTLYCRFCAEDILDCTILYGNSAEAKGCLVLQVEAVGQDDVCHCGECGRLLRYALEPGTVPLDADMMNVMIPASTKADDIYHVARLVEAIPGDADLIRAAGSLARSFPRF